jgi:uncharacterized membrane protein YfcA
LRAGEALAIFAAGFVAGIVNSIAGGGTLVSFPVLVALGREPLIANATNAVALFPGSLASAYGFRGYLSRERKIARLLIPVFAGSVVGAVLLLRTSAKTFAVVIPYLIVTATLLFALPERWTKAPAGPESPRRRWIARVMLVAIGVYGGYFGAGIGIMLLATLGILGIADLHERNGTKNILAAGANGMAAVLFVARGAVLWPDALVMMMGAIAGGFAGAHLAQRLGRPLVRAAIIAIGLVLTVWYFAHPVGR